MIKINREIYSAYDDFEAKTLRAVLCTIAALVVIGWTITVGFVTAIAISTGTVKEEPVNTDAPLINTPVTQYIEPVIAPVIKHIEPVAIPSLQTSGCGGNKADGMSGNGEKVVTYYNVPLSAETQDQIFKLCFEYGIDEKIVIAMCWRESLFNEDAVGDNGHSFGLMQIQERYHGERMERLGVDNLLDPVQNVTVGIDFIAELYGKYGDIEKALVCYNYGEYGARQNLFNNGVYTTNYSRSVIEYANSLEVCE